MLVVDVDDLKLAGPKKHLEEGEPLITSKLNVEGTLPASGMKVLGCLLIAYERCIDDGVKAFTCPSKAACKAAEGKVDAVSEHVKNKSK